MNEGPWPITRSCAIECAIITVSCLIDTHTKGVEYTKSEMIELLALLNQEKSKPKKKNNDQKRTKDRPHKGRDRIS